MTLWKIYAIFILASIQSGICKVLLRIVNGKDAKPGEFPYAVSLQYKVIDQHFCGGSIFNEHYIITAAHCVAKLWVQDVQVVVGTTDLNKPKSIHEAISLTPHENFEKLKHLANDIALIKVHPPIKFDQLVSPIVLPEAYYKIPKNAEVFIPGWGKTIDPKKDHVSNLKNVRVPIIDQDKCMKLYESTEKPYIFKTQFCTHEIGPIRKGVCTGDSGGPVTINNVLVGIVSWSLKDPKCASPKYPDVHTRVSDYVDWIKRHAV